MLVCASHRKFGRIFRRLCIDGRSRFAAPPPEHPVGDASVRSRGGFPCCQNEGIRCVKLSWLSLCCRFPFPPEPSPTAAQRHARGTEGLYARRAALLPCRDRSGRSRRSVLPAAKPRQDQPGLRPGAQEPRAVSAPRRIAGRAVDSIGFGGVFPYMEHAQKPRELPVPDDHRSRIAIRQNSPRRELSGGVVDHPSAPPRADPCVL